MLLQHMFLNWLKLTNFQRQKKEPWWKRRLEGKLKELIRDLDFVNILLEKRIVKKKHKDMLEKKYNIQRKRPNIVREKMKQQIKAVGAKIKPLNSRINQKKNRIGCLSTIKENFFSN